MKFISSAFALMTAACSFAASPSDFELFFFRNHASAGIELPLLITDHHKQRGVGEVRLNTLPGFAVKAEYAYNFNQYIGIASGVKVGTQVFAFDVNTQAVDFGLPKNSRGHFFQMIPFASIPLTLSPRFCIAGRHILQGDAGVSVLFYVPGNSISALTVRTGSGTEQIFRMTTLFADSPCFLFRAGLTYGFALKSCNLIKTGIAYHFGKRRILSGEYEFTKDDVVVGSGYVYSSFNYFALEFSYVFTRGSSSAVGYY